MASEVFLKELSSNNDIENAEVVAGVVRALAKKKFKKHLLQAVEADLPDLCLQLEMKLYKQLREKFKPWVCLRELDLAATVSLRGYDVIRRIEFHEPAIIWLPRVPVFLEVSNRRRWHYGGLQICQLES